MARIEILTGRERRRRWSEEDKRRMLAEGEDEGVSLAAVARRHDVHPQQLYGWRNAFRKTMQPCFPAPAFPPVEVRDPVEPEAQPGRHACGSPVEVMLRNGLRLRLDPTIAPETLCRLVRALETA